MRADCVDKLRQLANEEVTRSVLHQHRLLPLSLDRHEAHVRTGYRFADRLCISRIRLAPLDERLDLGGRVQPHIMAKLCQFP